MTVADWIRNMTDMELAMFLQEIISARDHEMCEELAEQGIRYDLVEMPVVAVANHLKFLQSSAEEFFNEGEDDKNERL